MHAVRVFYIRLMVLEPPTHPGTHEERLLYPWRFRMAVRTSPLVPGAICLHVQLSLQLSSSRPPLPLCL
jgi:hypothetical protein